MHKELYHGTDFGDFLPEILCQSQKKKNTRKTALAFFLIFCYIKFLSGIPGVDGFGMGEDGLEGDGKEIEALMLV